MLNNAILDEKKLPYLEFIQQEIRLSPKQSNHPLVIDLFAGCGGMALGFEAAGFNTIGYEILEDTCATYRYNLHSSCYQIILFQPNNSSTATLKPI